MISLNINMKTAINNKLLRETLWSFLAKGVASIFFIALNIFLARYFGSEKFGIWSFFFSILSIILLTSNLGINASTRKFVAQYNNTENLKAVLRSSLRVRLIFSFAFALLFMFLYRLLAVGVGRPNFELMFLFSVPIIFFSGLVEYLKAVFQGFYRLKYNFFINTSEQGLKFLLALFFLFFTGELVAILYSFNFALFITGIIGFSLLYFNFYRHLPPVNKSFEKRILKYSLPLFFATFSFAIAAEIDTVMIGFLNSNMQVGIYAVAKQIIIRLPHLSLAIALGAMPVFAQMTSGNKTKLRKLFYRLLRYNTFIFGAIIFIILTLGWNFIPLFFGAEYTKSALILALLTPYLFLASCSVFLDQLIDYRGLAKRRVINFTFTIILNILLNLLLIPEYGAIGAAISTSISYLPYTILNWVEMRKIFC